MARGHPRLPRLQGTFQEMIAQQIDSYGYNFRMRHGYVFVMLHALDEKSAAVAITTASYKDAKKAAFYEFKTSTPFDSVGIPTYQLEEIMAPLLDSGSPGKGDWPDKLRVTATKRSRAYRPDGEKYPRDPEWKKIYFKGFRRVRHQSALNAEKTLKRLGSKALDFCERYNYSTCWSSTPQRGAELFDALEKTLPEK